MATTRSWTGRDGERRDETLYIDVTVWDRQAENCCQYLRKGSAIHVEGSLKMDTWPRQEYRREAVEDQRAPPIGCNFSTPEKAIRADAVAPTKTTRRGREPARRGVVGAGGPRCWRPVDAAGATNGPRPAGCRPLRESTMRITMSILARARSMSAEDDIPF